MKKVFLIFVTITLLFLGSKHSYAEQGSDDEVFIPLEVLILRKISNSQDEYEISRFDTSAQNSGAYQNLEGTIILPSHNSDWKPIVGISHSAFRDLGWKGTLVIPPTYKFTEQLSFAGNNFSSLIANSLITVHGGSFLNNDLEYVEMENVESIKFNAFMNNKLKELDLPKLETIEMSAFQQNELRVINLPSMKILEDLVFSGNPNIETFTIGNKLESSQYYSFEGALKVAGYNNLFDIIATNVGRNVFDYKNHVVYNFNKDTLEEDFIEPGKDQEIITSVNGEYHVGISFSHDHKWYCADGYVPMMDSSVYDIIRDVHTVYIVEQGPDVKYAQYEFNTAPTDYQYSYDAELISKVIYQLENNFNVDKSIGQEILWLLNSNSELLNVHLNSDNLINLVEKTSRYGRLIKKISENELLDILTNAVDDTRSFSNSSFAYLADNDYNYHDSSQSLFTPGEPIEEEIPLVPLEPSKPNIPLTPLEPSKPKIQLVPLEPSKPNIPLVPIDPIDPNIPLIPLEPANPNTPLIPVTPENPGIPTDRDKPIFQKKPGVSDSQTPPTLPNTGKKNTVTGISIGLLAVGCLFVYLEKKNNF